MSQRFRLILVLCAACLAGPLLAEDVDPDNDGSQFAWSGNTGWINAEPGGDSGPGMALDDEEASGWFWAANTGWVSLSCENTATCATVSYRVENDGSGNLSGYAWSPNTGWISFSCENTKSCGVVDYGVVVDDVSGEMSGYAWSANVGWISFSCENTATCKDVDYGIKLDQAPPPGLDFQDGFETI